MGCVNEGSGDNGDPPIACKLGQGTAALLVPCSPYLDVVDTEEELSVAQQAELILSVRILRPRFFRTT